MTPRKIYIFLILGAIIIILAAVFVLFKMSSQNKTTGNVASSQVSQDFSVHSYGEDENDRDADGLEDSYELEMGLKINDPDTDGDGLSDNFEMSVWHTSPTSSDTDNDGFPDGIELMNGYNPSGPGKLN